MGMRVRMIGVLGLVAVAAACGKQEGDDEAIVKALGAEEKKAAVDEKALAQRKAERMAKEAAAKAAEDKKQAAIDAAASLPEGGVKIKDVGRACRAVADAHDDFMRRHFSGEDLEKWDASKSFQMDMTRKNCAKHGSAEVAACQKHALETAGPELSKEAPAMMLKCIDKFTQAKGAVPPG